MILIKMINKNILFICVILVFVSCNVTKDNEGDMDLQAKTSSDYQRVPYDEYKKMSPGRTVEKFIAGKKKLDTGTSGCLSEI